MTFARNAFAEGLGTLLLVTAVVGSGIMAERLSGGNVGVALLANAIATGAALYVLITTMAPLSGAQFNPLVSLWLALEKEQSIQTTFAYVFMQIVGGILGAVLANVMFDLAPVQMAQTVRGGTGQWVAEVVASFGLLLTIMGCRHGRSDAVAPAVALYITSAYWFTSSTSFANPAVTIARMFSDSFAGIYPGSVLPFIIAQLAGMALAIGAGRLLFGIKKT